MQSKMAMNLPCSPMRPPLIRKVREAFPGAEPELCLCHHFTKLLNGSCHWVSISPGYFSPPVEAGSVLPMFIK